MRSLILSALARPFFGLMLAVSVVILFRGHNEPGGGFVGGLVAAAGFAILALADGGGRARAALRVHPVELMGAGLLLSFISGLPGIFSDGSFLTHLWITLPVGGGLKLGTTMVFDLGVYLVVLGGVLALILRLYEEPSA